MRGKTLLHAPKGQQCALRAEKIILGFRYLIIYTSFFFASPLEAQDAAKTRLPVTGGNPTAEEA